MTVNDRKPRRARTAFRAEIEGKGISGRGEVKNIGEGGLFVGTPLNPEPGDCVQLRFTTPLGGRLEVLGMVWWTSRRRGKPGFGVRLLEANRGYDRLVSDLLAR